MFAQLTVVGDRGRRTDIDLGVDWRERPPVRLEIGPVLSVEDAVGNKIAALFSRAEARDYLDADAIRNSGRFADDELLELALAVDPGFELVWFVQVLENVDRIQHEEVLVYEIDPEHLAGMKQRMMLWAKDIRQRFLS